MIRREFVSNETVIDKPGKEIKITKLKRDVEKLKGLPISNACTRERKKMITRGSFLKIPGNVRIISRGGRVERES